MRHAIYEIVESESTKQILVIRDMCAPFKSITNDAEWVVDQLAQSGRIVFGMRLLYYDTYGDKDEILLRMPLHGVPVFDGFKVLNHGT